MDTDTAKILVGAALSASVAAFSIITVSGAVIAMLRDLNILAPRPDRDGHNPAH